MISFYDTSTLPTQDMLDAIARAPLGDDVYGLDSTVNELEAVAAGLMGKDAAVLPGPGQQQVDRAVFAERTHQVPALTVIEDNAVGYTTPRAGVQTVRGQVTMVCYAGTGQTGCAWDSRQTPPGTWSQVIQTVWASRSDITAGGGLSAADLARGITKGYWQVVGRTRLDGQPAIELSETGRGPDLWAPLPTLLWVNARTHLPIRMVNGVGHAQWDVNEWAFLPPTAASLARLRVPIPPGTRAPSRPAERLGRIGAAALLLCRDLGPVRQPGRGLHLAALCGSRS